jgi:hypothetical protein
MIIIKRLVQFFVILPALLLLYINGGLYYSPNFKTEGQSVYNQDVLSQLRYLKNELHNNQAGQKMQALFPEGFVFTTVLYGLAWTDFVEHIDKKHPLFREANEEIKWCIAEINSDKGKAVFSNTLPLKYGAFYNGWSSYLAGKYLIINDLDKRDTAIANQFINQCQAISEAIKTAKFDFLESYPQSAWQADNIVCLASLSLHDKIYPPQYKMAIDTLLNNIKANSDARTGLIAHIFKFIAFEQRVRTFDNGEESYKPNRGWYGARGSSQSLINCFLPDIDSVFAKDQFEKYKQHFIEYKFGLPAVREYPIGIDNDGDVDSGPVILGVGSSASIVAIRAMAENKDGAFYIPIRNAIEAFGFTNSSGTEKKYLFGQLADADAFIAWSNAKMVQNLPEPHFFWRLTFHLLSLLVIALICWLAYKL